MDLVNLTPYAVNHSIKMDGTGRETLLVLVKATFALQGGRPKIADKQHPLALADEYLGDPLTSSLRNAAEGCLFKPSADVTLQGLAYTTRGQRSEALVALQVGSMRKAVRVIGDRLWEGRLGPRPSRPEPFVHLPLIYERAFGGSDNSAQPAELSPENPVGRGFRAKSSRTPVAGSALPNLEDPLRPLSDPSDCPRPRCFGPIAPHWSPRIRYAGTYDAAWQRQRMPLPPLDFDPRFDHATPTDQVLGQYLRGGEPITITGVRPDGGGYHFNLPGIAPEIVVRVGGERETPQVRCDTLIIDCQAERLSLVSRATMPVQGRVSALEWIKVHEPARG